MLHWKLTALCGFILFTLTGCIKLQVLPEDSIQKGFDASKSLVDQARLAREGGKKMTFATEVKISGASSQSADEAACLAEIKNRAAVASPKRAYELITERTRLGKSAGIDLVGCEITVFVWN